MTYEFTTTRRVEFADTDMAGIMHFSNYFRFMESVEHAFFRSLDLTVHPAGEDVQGWARVQAACDYHAPLRYEDEVEVHLVVTEMGARSMTYAAAFRRAGDPAVLARGRWTTVCVGRDADGRMRSVDMPADVAARIEAAPPGTLDGKDD
ncbi:MAG: acyl-CoA thioesterase [Planctomycetota bacterium]|jgi:YbgC/YbaW family acyl-CoA thioester hydrolase